ncbi:MAG: FAD-dependent oxidoreductase, partial [Eubacteriales bacterium]|nr:FAD-dependent oxidoreductase [Eubacteriales bacterium]
DESGVTAVEVTEQTETESIGGAALPTLVQEVVNSKAFAADAVSGATFTSNGFNAALADAENQAKGIVVEVSTETNVADGTYTATVPSLIDTEGLAGIGELTLEATFADNKITSITVPAYTDTKIIGGMAFDILSQRVVENQSTDIDALSGATVSSNAFFSALNQCIEQAGGDPAAFKARTVAKDEAQQITYDADIVIIGAGMAGLSAAIEGAEEGANVVVCEAQEVFGSSTSRSLGFVMGAGTENQKAQGIEDTAEQFYEDIYSLYKDEKTLDTDLLKKLTYDSTDLNAWLQKQGVVFTGVINVTNVGVRALQRVHCTDGFGSGLITALQAAAAEKGVNLLMGTKVDKLLMDESGAVTGVHAVNTNGDEVTVNAQATIVCSGSYTQNAEMLAELNPKMDNIEVITGCGDGSSINFFRQAGADIVNVDYIQMMYYFYGASWGDKFPESIPGSPTVPNYDVLMVDGGGNRVIGEDDYCFEYVKRVWDAGYNEGYAIYGQATADKYPVMTELGLTTKTARDLPFGYCEDTSEALAADVGMDPAVLQATVDRYNSFCASGVDEDYGKNPENLLPIEAPFYILRLPQICTDGYTGARINENAQVLSTAGEPIKGLYAAGSCADAQVTSVNYNGCGTSLLTCGVFGRAAAKDAVSKLIK